MRIPRMTAGIQSVAVVTLCVHLPRTTSNDQVCAHSRTKGNEPVGGPPALSRFTELRKGQVINHSIGLCEINRLALTFRSTGTCVTPTWGGTPARHTRGGSMRDDGWAGEGDDETVARTEQASEAIGTAAIATVIMVMMVALLLVHALA